MDLFAHPITSQVISILVAALCGWLGAQVASMHTRDRALYEGMKVILRSSITDAYERYVTEEAPLTVERKREIDEAWAAYSALGGNGTGRQMYEDICDRPIVIVK